MAYSTAQNDYNNAKSWEGGLIPISDIEGENVASFEDAREEGTCNTGGGSFRYIIWKFFIVMILTNLSSHRTTPKHKTSHLRFLTWVAYVRKESPNINETERRTCPLVECKEPFKTLEAMLQHVYTCPRLTKNGLYECCDCKKKERVSKFHSNGCHNLHRFPTVANSLRLAKRLLSSHGPKNRQTVETAVGRQASPKQGVELPTHEPHYSGTSELAVDSTIFSAELDTSWRDNPHDFIPELHSFEVPGKLPVYDKYPTHWGFQSQDTCSELSAGHDSAYVSDHQSCSGYTRAELSTGEHSHQQNTKDSLSGTEDMSNLSHEFFLSSVPPSCHQHLPRQDFGCSNYPKPSYGDTSFPEPQSPLASLISEYDYPKRVFISNSGSRTNTNVSALSTGSIPSSKDTWISSFDSIDSRAEYCEESHTPFFEEGSNLMFSEPELIEESIEPVELPRRIYANSPKSTLEHSNPQNFPLKASFINPVQFSTAVIKAAEQ
jgi:hypothetical protein